MHKIVTAQALPHHILRVTFDDGLQKDIDMTPVLREGGVGAALQNEQFFHRVTIDDGGGVSWPNGFDCCPTYLREVQVA